jgi:hypothetical protein
VLNQKAAVEQTRRMLKWRETERGRLDWIHDYLRNRQRTVTVPSGVPREVQRLADMAKVNVLPLVVDGVSQSLYVDGYRTGRSADASPAWSIWQSNKMDARQLGVHRSSVSYGASYVTVLPGDTAPAIRGKSPRRMSSVYGEDDTWPLWALEAVPSQGRWMYRLYDDEAVYFLDGNSHGSEVAYVDTRRHGQGVCPVIRFVNVVDLDDEVVGEVEPLIPLQDQINVTTFGLLVAQHYGAFRQRWILGWVAESEQEKLHASASRLWTFEDSPDDVKVGEFAETDLKGYLDSREATLRHLASVSQTPAHELVGQLVNLSAEALAAADASQRRKIAERETTFGESWEQVLALAGSADGLEVDPGAQVRWRDTESRSLAQTADALGKLAQMLGVPPRALWEKVPGVTQDDLLRWETLAAEDDSLGNLTALLDRQMAG